MTYYAPYLYWYSGFFNESHPAKDGSDFIFYQHNGREALPGKNKREDMTIDSRDFEMTVGNVQLEDEAGFTCRGFTAGTDEYFPVRVNVIGM